MHEHEKPDEAPTHETHVWEALEDLAKAAAPAVAMVAAPIVAGLAEQAIDGAEVVEP